MCGSKKGKTRIRGAKCVRFAGKKKQERPSGGIKIKEKRHFAPRGEAKKWGIR